MGMQTTTPTRRLTDLPAPRGVPVLGNLLDADPTRLHLTLERWAAELGSPYLLRLGPQKFFVSADADQLQSVLRERPERYRRLKKMADCIEELGGHGVFSVEGEAWRPQRKLVMEALNATHFRAFLPVIHGITLRLLQRWQRAAAAGETVEMTQDLIRYTVDVTTALAFGEDPNTLETDGDVIQNHLAELFPRLMARINAPFPYWRYVKLPADHRLDRALAQVHHHIDRLIASTRQRMAAAPGKPPANVLEAMLAAAADPQSQISDADVRANVQTLLLAGEDTTAHTLAWTMYHLAQSPSWQDRLHVQVREAIGPEPLPATVEALRQLDLLESAANEATRLKPIVPLFFLEPLADVVLDGVELPAGTPMIFLLRPSMLDETRFGDPLAFRPERWQHGQAPGAHDPRAYVQFGAGPRVCPGRHLAGVEIRMVLAALLQHFRIELAVEPQRIREVMAFTMTPDRMPVRLSVRGTA